MDLAYIGIHESHTHGLDSLPWMAWQTEDQTVVISLKTPMVNMCQNQNFFLIDLQLLDNVMQVQVWGYHGGSEGKESACNAGDLGLALVWEDPQRRKWQPTAVFLPREFMDRGAWWTTVCGVVKSQVNE